MTNLYTTHLIATKPVTTIIQERIVVSPPETIVKHEPGYVKPQGRKLKVHCSFYTDADNSLEGGKLDIKGKKLSDFDYPVVAMPKDIPYGSIIEIKGVPYTVVDTGDAITWVGDDECNVDIFIPGKSSEWLEKYTGVFDANATLYEAE